VYGFKTFADYFTSRQLIALATFSDLVSEVRERVLCDSVTAGLPDDGVPLNNGGTSTTAYADAVATYLAFAVDRSADFWCALCTWAPQPKNEIVAHVFGRQALPMVWDFAEANPFSESGGSFTKNLGFIAKVIEASPLQGFHGHARQLDATSVLAEISRFVTSTDPPYYDNVSYADLADFFYVWLRRSLGTVYPDLSSTMLTPKTPELVATPYRFGGDKEKAQRFFEEGLGKAFTCMRKIQYPDYPLTVYYAFKQSEAEVEDEGGNGTAIIASTGWETMLEGLIRAGFTITGTWPMRTERPTGIKVAINVLASSIVLVCRPRPESAPLTTRREFLTALKRELPDSLKHLQHGNIAPVDLAQASIGPGMAIFSRYTKVLEADGTPMRVRTALALINQTLDEVLAEQEGEFDADTRWAVAWFEQNGFDEGPFGVAETLSKAKNTAIQGLVDAGILTAKAGKVRLLRRDELDPDWDPVSDRRLPVWEATQRLILSLEKDGESGAAQLRAKVGATGELARDLAYRLYMTCERKKWAQDALAFNSLVVSWPEISRLATQTPGQPESQQEMFER
jgi:putative DNA methylase